jgi:outer membrane biosynthesis protein TonB
MSTIKQNEPPATGSDKVCVFISIAFHAVIVGALVLLAAHEGMLGKQLKKIAVEIVHEKPPEKPKELEKPKEEPPKVETQVAQTPKVEAAKEAPRVTPPPEAASASPVVAPPPAELPAFDFGGGKAVQSSSNPIDLYRSYVEATLRHRWSRPVGLADDSFVAEVEVTVGGDGEISSPAWKKSSGNTRWDQSVREAIAASRSLERPPPAHFPSRVLVRFDVEETTEALLTQ